MRPNSGWWVDKLTLLRVFREYRPVVHREKGRGCVPPFRSAALRLCVGVSEGKEKGKRWKSCALWIGWEDQSGCSTELDVYLQSSKNECMKRIQIQNNLTFWKAEVDLRKLVVSLKIIWQIPGEDPVQVFCLGNYSIHLSLSWVKRGGCWLLAMLM